MILSLILPLPDCTTKTSFSRILVKIFTLVSPYTSVSWATKTTYNARTFANCESSTGAGAVPRLEHIWLVSWGQELPAKIRVLRIFDDVRGRKLGLGTKRKYKLLGDRSSRESDIIQPPHTTEWRRHCRRNNQALWATIPVWPMGIPHLITFLRPYANHEPLAGRDVVIDGPGLR